MYLKQKLKSNDAQNCFRIRTVNSLPAWNFWLMFIIIRALQTKLFRMKNKILRIAKYSKRKEKKKQLSKSTVSVPLESLLHLCLLLILWKLGLIGWLDGVPWSVPRTGWNGTRGALVGTRGAFLFNSLGTSSLSSIRDVFTSSCLLLSCGDRTRRSYLGWKIQEGELILGASLTIRFSHSSVTRAESRSSSPIVGSECGISSSMTTTFAVGFEGTKASSEESYWVEFRSAVTSFKMGRIDLRHLLQVQGIRLVHNLKLSPLTTDWTQAIRINIASVLTEAWNSSI